MKHLDLSSAKGSGCWFLAMLNVQLHIFLVNFSGKLEGDTRGDSESAADPGVLTPGQLLWPFQTASAKNAECIFFLGVRFFPS